MQASQIIILNAAALTMFSVIGFLSLMAHYYTLNGIKSKTVGDGQHGTARWASKREIKTTYTEVRFESEEWRKGENIPTAQGLVVGWRRAPLFDHTAPHGYALVADDDIHCLMIGAAGVGKTANKTKWFAGAALNSAEQAMQRVLSIAISRLNAFLDSELEQVLCFDTAIDAENFRTEKSAIFVVMPEEDNTKYFIISLIV